MNEKTRAYQLVELPPQRRVMPAILDLTWRKHCMYGLLEVDVTQARQVLEAYKAQTGESLSLTGYLVYCLARAVDENKAVQAYMKGSGQLVVVDDVDVGIMVEHRTGAQPVLTGHVIRDAGHKSYLEIHREIRAAQSKPVSPAEATPAWFRLVASLPWPLAGWFRALLAMAVRRDPALPAALSGTVGVTAVGMFARGLSAWGLTPTMHSLDLAVGGIAVKPAVVEGRIAAREILHLTVVFDHDVIDGAPATRFVRRLVELIESGAGLDEARVAASVSAEPYAFSLAELEAAMGRAVAAG